MCLKCEVSRRGREGRVERGRREKDENGGVVGGREKKEERRETG